MQVSEVSQWDHHGNFQEGFIHYEVSILGITQKRRISEEDEKK